MRHGLENVNEFYTSNYWDESLAKDLSAKLASLPSSDARAKALHELDRDYWSIKDRYRRGMKDTTEHLLAFYRKVFAALNFSPSESRGASIEDGAEFPVFATAGENEARLMALVVDRAEVADFEGVPAGAPIPQDVLRDERDVRDIFDEEFFRIEPPLRWGMMLAPERMLIATRSKWGAGRYLAVDWEAVFSQRSFDVYRELLGLLACEHLVPSSGASVHDEWDESSDRRAFAVTTELRSAVREGIEALVKEMVHSRRESHKKFMPDAEPESYARELSHDALFYIYRIIFLLFVESRDVDDSLPLKSALYRGGYSIEKLVEVCLQDLEPHAPEYEGDFLDQSLKKIFALIWNGYNPAVATGSLGFDRVESRTGFFVKGLKADLFDPARLKHLGDVKIRNCVLQRLIKSLTFSKGEGRKAQVGRISYASLGVNQLGAVYEGLLSYTGYFAKEPLYYLKVAETKQADFDRDRASESVFLCPKSLADTYRKHKTKKYQLTDDNFARVSVDDPKLAEVAKGDFVYRLAGRDRQKLASYYTPESLTRLTVKYALKVLFESKKTPTELLQVKILEPAMGSGAFLGEAVRQLAEHINDLEQLNPQTRSASPEARAKRRAEIRYQLIANNVYGVDLNPTAIELAKFTLWLGALEAGKDPPDFTGRLELGNSLIGARFDLAAAGVYPWLMLDEGMLAYDKKLKDYDASGFEAVKEFRKKLLSSQLSADKSEVQVVQRAAAAEFAKLPDLEAARRLGMACDLWCCYFFLLAADLGVMPATHGELLAVIGELLAGRALTQKVAAVVKRIVAEERFFHWEVRFAEVLRSGGFDLILANPPWVAVGWQDSLYVSDLNPVPACLNLNAADTRVFVKSAEDSRLNRYLAQQYIRVDGYTKMLATAFYADIAGSQKNTYKAFDVLMMRVMAPAGAIGVIQEDGALEDEDGTALRANMYRRFRYHFQFQNAFNLFAEVGHRKRYSVNIFSTDQGMPKFSHIGNLFTPYTVDATFEHNAPHDPVPMVQDKHGNWETRPHRQRVIEIDSDSIRSFGAFLNQQDSLAPAFLNLHSRELLGFVENIGACKTTFGDLAGEGGAIGSEMLHETGAQDDGLIKKAPGTAKNIETLVLSGPNIEAGNPFAKECRVAAKSKGDYDPVDLEAIDDDFVPRTVYQFVGDLKKAETKFRELAGKPYRSFYRVATRNMVSPTNARCCFAAIIAPGAMHIHTVASVAFSDPLLTLLCAGITGSLVADAILRLRSAGHFYYGDFASFPAGSRRDFDASIQRRVVALQCLTSAYKRLWSGAAPLAKTSDSLLNGLSFANLKSTWTKSSPLRAPADREQALIEIDALVALSFNLTVAELLQIYEILFPVLVKYDREASFDRKAKLEEAHAFFAKRGW